MVRDAHPTWLDGAAASLYDPKLEPKLRAAFAESKPSLEKLLAEISMGASGSNLESEVFAKLKAPLTAASVVEKGACFIAGTLVHTDKGLVPIEQIKVGDLVLSAPENGEWELAYKPVTNTFVRHDQPIVRVVYYSPDANEPNQGYALTATLDHPFLLEGIGWTAACLLGEARSVIDPPQLRLSNRGEPPRLWWRLQPLRRWSHEEVNEVFPRGA